MPWAAAGRDLSRNRAGICPTTAPDLSHIQAGLSYPGDSLEPPGVGSGTRVWCGRVPRLILRMAVSLPEDGRAMPRAWRFDDMPSGFSRPPTALPQHLIRRPCHPSRAHARPPAEPCLPADDACVRDARLTIAHVTERHEVRSGFEERIQGALILDGTGGPSDGPPNLLRGMQYLTDAPAFRFRLQVRLGCATCSGSVQIA